MKKAIALLVTISILIGISGCALGDLVSQAPTATPTPSRTPKPTFTPLPTDTPTPEATPTATNTPVVVPTDTPAPVPSPTATPTATSTPIPPPTPTSPPPTATPTNTPTPEVKPCSYVEGSRKKSAGGKPGEGQPVLEVEGYILDATDAGRNDLGVYFEHIDLGTWCVVSGDSAHTWQPGQWKHTFWGSPGANTKYYLTIMESCAPGARALSPKTEFPFSWWGKAGHQFDIRFKCNF